MSATSDALTKRRLEVGEAAPASPSGEAQQQDTARAAAQPVVLDVSFAQGPQRHHGEPAPPSDAPKGCVKLRIVDDVLDAVQHRSGDGGHPTAPLTRSVLVTAVLQGMDAQLKGSPSRFKASANLTASLR